MAKKEIKHKAQDEIMSMLANTLTSFQELNRYTDADEVEAVSAEIKIQMNRVAKLMGYKEAWHN